MFRERPTALAWFKATIEAGKPSGHAMAIAVVLLTTASPAAVTGKIDVRDMSRGGAENAEKTK